MSHVETDIGYTDGRYDQHSSELAYSRTYAGHTRGSNEDDSDFFVTASCGYISDRYTVPIVGVCRARGVTGIASVQRECSGVKLNIQLDGAHFGFSSQSNTFVNASTKD